MPAAWYVLASSVLDGIADLAQDGEDVVQRAPLKSGGGGLEHRCLACTHGLERSPPGFGQLEERGPQVRRVRAGVDQPCGREGVRKHLDVLPGHALAPRELWHRRRSRRGERLEDGALRRGHADASMERVACGREAVEQAPDLEDDGVQGAGR
jgi:hypothetical protein